MPTQKDIDDFLARKRIAFVGVSRDPKAFTNAVYRSLRDRGYQLYPVNPHAEQLEGARCYPTVKDLPEPVDGALVMLPPGPSEQVVRDCAEAGIRRVWLRGGVHRGTISAEAVRYCREHGMSVVDNACPMMFAEPVGFLHRCHRFFSKLRGTLPS